jgi:hypothetical protein
MLSAWGETAEGEASSATAIAPRHGERTTNEQQGEEMGIEGNQS